MSVKEIMIRYSASKVDRLAVLGLLFICLLALGGCSSGSPGDGSVILEGPSIEMTSTYSAGVPALGYRERAMITQGTGEYAGVDDWINVDPVPAGTRLVNGGTGGSFSADFSDRATVAYSNYFTSEQTRDIAMSGGLLDASFFSGLVEVGPWRADGTTGDFTYRRYAITYDVMRPMPAAYGICLNNPQMNTAGAGGAPQYFVPFIRQDLIRLGYVRITMAEDSSLSSRLSTLPRYTALYGRTATADELGALALADYTTLMASRPPSEQDRAAALRSEAMALRLGKKRSDQSFSALAASGDIALAAGIRIDGFARVDLNASRDILLSGTIWGSDRITSSASGRCRVGAGALVEAWTDRLAAGDEAVCLTCGVLDVDGRVQIQAAPWTSWSRGVPGKITMAASSTDPTVSGIAIGRFGQVLALLQTSQPDASLNAVGITSAGSAIEIDGPGYGFNVVADKGTIRVENSGARGAVHIRGGAALSADAVKTCASGSYGTLVIEAGANLDAGALLKLVGGISPGGAVIFRGAGDILLTSGTGTNPIVISADTVVVETGARVVTRSWTNTGGAWSRVDRTADVYCSRCAWNAAGGGDPEAGYEGTWSVTPNRTGAPSAGQCF